MTDEQICEELEKRGIDMRHPRREGERLILTPRGQAITDGFRALLSAALAQQEQQAPAVQEDELRRAVRSMTAMLESRECAEHVSTDPDAVALESAITELVGAANEKATAKKAHAEWIQCHVCGNAFNRTESPDGHACDPAPAQTGDKK